MSARIAPRVDTMGIAFSPHLPRFLRQDRRRDQNDSKRDQQTESEPATPQTGFVGSAERSLPPATIFEAALLGNQQAIDPLSPYEMARRQRNEWSPPAYGFQLTDKII